MQVLTYSGSDTLGSFALDSTSFWASKHFPRSDYPTTVRNTQTHTVFGNAFELKNVEFWHPRFVNIPITSAFHNLRQLEADRLFNIYETRDVFRMGWLSLQMKKLNYSTSFIASPWADVVFCLRHKNPLELDGALIKASCLRSSVAQVPKFYYLQLITDFGVFSLLTWMRV